MAKQVETILAKMSNVKKPQRRFIIGLFAVLMVFQGRANFRNLSRFSTMSEKCFSRWFRRDFNFAQFNTELLIDGMPDSAHCIAAIDASFVSKSGNKTQGLGWFYNGSAGEAQKGLEVSLLSVVDLSLNTAYALDIKQTLDDAGKTVDEVKKTRVNFYAEQVQSQASSLAKLGIKYIVGDAYYSKKKFVAAVDGAGFKSVGKLRIDADMKWLYQGPYSGFGRPRQYDGKVDIDSDLSRFEQAESLPDGTEVYSATVYSVHLKRKIKLVILRKTRDQKQAIALLFSTDLSLAPRTLIQYYKARFQIEFLFRDAKQYTGLTHCQSRDKKAIHTQVNASMSTLNLLKLEDRTMKQEEVESVISIASWRRKKFNQHLILRLFDELGLSMNSRKVSDVYERMLNYGAIAA